MGRKLEKYNNYQNTIFSNRLSALQDESGESNSTVVSNLVDEEGNQIFNDEQTYRNYKNGKRFKQKQITMLISIAEYYNVTTDYLLGYDNDKNPQIKAVAEELHLSETAITGIKRISENAYKPLIQILDTLLSNSYELENLLNDIYNHIYRNHKNTMESSLDIERINYDLLFSIKLMKYIEQLITPSLQEYMKLREVEEQYYQSEEYEKERIQEISKLKMELPT